MDAQRDEEAAAAPLLAAPAGSKLSPAADAHILSAAFLFVFAAYGAAQNLESTVNTDGDLGTVSLGILYTSFTLFSVVAPPVVTRLGPKRALVVGSSGYVLFILANLVPTWYTMVPASLYLGFCASIIWVGQGTYLTSAALSHARENNLPEGRTLGNFTGEFWAIIGSTQVIGNLLSLALLRNGKDGGSVTGKNLLFVVFLGCMIVGIVLMCLLSKREEKGYNHPLHSSFGAMLKNASYPPKNASYYPSYGVYRPRPSFCLGCIHKEHCYTCAWHSWSWWSHGNLWCSWCNCSPIVGVLGAAAPLLIGALWGVGDGMLNTELNAVVGLLFEDAKEAAFAQFKVWECGAVAVVFFLGPHITLQAMLVLMTVALFISFGAFLFLTIVVEKSSVVRS